MIAGITVGLNLHRFGGNIVRPPNCPTSDKWSVMRPPVPESDPPSLWDQRVGFIFRVLVDPRCALDFVTDPAVREALEAGSVHTLKVLFLAAAALEQHEQGMIFSEHAI